ncbi:MAG: FAD-dependent oxidoreductase [Terrisporobacter othiniensis]|uniref:dihydrolipoyl dehydrogenase family protein n=1 Tax=Terrisporobacter othiniensis TaxID=1577792 RepID=UPI002A757A01|nr:FAD-dependent oxidoreductase [Terrisporobacter othiniensis]MDY3374190.1 FAD-dependent oxidoreductase [Terrisporobacter othiniensis]
MINKFDAIIIGFGKGGKTLAGDLASRGQKVALIEKSQEMYGGTCINKACIPTKILENKSSIIRRQNLDNFNEKEIKYEESINQKEELISKLRMANYNKLNSNENITIFTGQGSFISENTIEVKTIDGEVRTLEGEKIFINTGSRPNIPDIKGIENSNIVYTNETLMKLKKLPNKITIIGAGYIGLEFAGIYASFGSEVAVVNTHSTILPKEDNDDVEEVVNILQKRNVNFLNDVSIIEIKQENQLAKLIYKQNGEDEERELSSEIVLVATGRKANIEGLSLDKANVELDSRGFIKVNEELETTTKNIWALGDVNGGPQFTYISLDDYRIIRNHLFEDKTRKTTDRKNVPNALFLDPAFSRVGLNVKEAKANGHNILVAKMATEAIPRAKQIGKTDGFIKIVIDKDSNKILGATMICEDSSEMIHLIQLAIDMGVKYTYLRDRIYAHPTMTEALNDILSPAMIKEV